MERNDGPVGMTLLQVSSKEEAERIATNDPAVQAGLLKVQVKTWYVPDRG